MTIFSCTTDRRILLTTTTTILKIFAPNRCHQVYRKPYRLRWRHWSVEWKPVLLYSITRIHVLLLMFWKSIVLVYKTLVYPVYPKFLNLRLIINVPRSLVKEIFGNESGLSIASRRVKGSRSSECDPSSFIRCSQCWRRSADCNYFWCHQNVFETNFPASTGNFC